QEALLLLLVGHVEKELANDDAIARQISLEVAYVLVAIVPDLLGDELGRQHLAIQELGMNTDDERLFIVAAIEDADASPFRQRCQASPEVVVIEILGRRRLERKYLATLRIDPGHDVLDRAVLPRRVHGLEDEQDGPAVLGIEHVL